MGKIKLIIVDDHKVYRDGLKLNLLEYENEIQIIGEAESGNTLFALLETHIPNLLLLDYQLPDTTGIDIVVKLQSLDKFKGIKSIILSSHVSEKYGLQCYDFVLQALEAGANGYLLKSSTGEEIYSALIEAYGGGCFVFGESFNFKEVTKFLAEDRGKLISFLTRQSKLGITKRELEVIELLAQGLIVKEISEKMAITEDSVNSHKENIRSKVLQNYGINLRNTVEIVVWAIKNKLIKV